MAVNQHHATSAFTLIEVLLTSAVLLIFSTVAIRSMFTFNEQRKLRTAAVELSGYLQVARAVANAQNKPCTIKLKSEDGGVFTPDASFSDNACKDGTLPPAVRLGGHAGSNNLKATPMPQKDRGTFPLTFTPGGTAREGATVRVSSAQVPAGAWCVDVEPPLGTVRLGWQQQDGNCNYAIEQ